GGARRRRVGAWQWPHPCADSLFHRRKPRDAGGGVRGPGRAGTRGGGREHGPAVQGCGLGRQRGRRGASAAGAWRQSRGGGTAARVKMMELASAANMKRTWASARSRDWLDSRQGEGREFLRHASEVKNIWIPYGE